MALTVDEVDNLFKTDETGKFLNLIIPEDMLGPQMCFIGKRMLDLSLDEVVRIKKYADMLYENAE